MAEKKTHLCESVLEKLAFERSKRWSNFFKVIEEGGDNSEAYEIHELEEKYKDTSSEDERRCDAEEAEEVNDPENKEHHSILNSVTEDGKNACTEWADVQDILNVTRPILEAHERKWKKAGLERILNTFDSDRIEKEVGGWMRRNNSANCVKVKSDTDTDSSISCDTGRYIRSTQKNGFRRRNKCVNSIKKLKNSQRIRHRHGMLIEATTYRAYKYNCCKYNKPNTVGESGLFQQQETTDTDAATTTTTETEDDGYRDKRKGRYVKKYDSSSDSEYASPKKRTLVRRKLHRPNTELLPFNESGVTCDKPWSNSHRRARLTSMIEPRYETPPRSSVANINIFNTAPSKLTNVRPASKKALARISTINGEKTPPIKSKNIQKASDSNSSFEINLKKAIALLKTHHKNQKHSTTSKKEKVSSENSVSEDSITTTEILELNNDLNTENGAVLKDSNSIIPISSNDSEKSSRTDQILPKTRKLFNRIKPIEDPFLTSVENICNSTALDGVAVRKQLISRLPSIRESLEILPTTPRCTGRQNQNDCHATVLKRSAVPKQMTDCLPTKNKCLTSRSNLPHTMSTEFENLYNSTALSDVKTGKELIMCPKQRTVSEPRRKLKRQMIPIRRKSATGENYAASALFSPDTSKKSTTAQKRDTRRKPKRIQLYTPQQKEHVFNGYFHVTRELLSSVIGEKDACRFFKYHLGRLSFPSTSTVYYCSPEVELSSSDSEDDPLLKVGCCGELYESVSHDDNGAV